MICWHWSQRRHSSPAQEQRWWFQLCYFLFLPITQGRIKRILSGLCWIWHILFWRAPSPSAPCGHWHRQPRFPEAVGLQVKSFQAEINFQVALQPPAVRSWVTIYHDNINKNKKNQYLKDRMLPLLHHWKIWLFMQKCFWEQQSYDFAVALFLIFSFWPQFCTGA